MPAWLIHSGEGEACHDAARTVKHQTQRFARQIQTFWRWRSVFILGFNYENTSTFICHSGRMGTTRTPPMTPPHHQISPRVRQREALPTTSPQRDIKGKTSGESYISLITHSIRSIRGFFSLDVTSHVGYYTPKKLCQASPTSRSHEMRHKQDNPGSCTKVCRRNA